MITCQGTAIDGPRCAREELSTRTRFILFLGLVWYTNCRRAKTCNPSGFEWTGSPWTGCLWTLDMDRCRLTLGLPPARVCLTLARLDDPQPARCRHHVCFNGPLGWYILAVDPPCRNGESWCWGQGTFNLGVCHDFYHEFSRQADRAERAS